MLTSSNRKNRGVLGLLSENPYRGVLDLSDDVLQELKLKHVEVSPKYHALLPSGPVSEVYDIIFNDINEELIEKSAI